ncbi:MAG: cytochrome c [Bradyrhizobium sp.]|uniref:c-type cytochrome n=1 Tax=Bradyrhizobium sp. TaxID=376 RepID=UPI00271FF83C|nr:cytochrome c [Bradyrhizobium sp.]MDO9561192.1 cytochrome c [Bradyrhizobium sp.]MDP3691029.1 cytochrome c [Bradyrhizobium sp.]
MMRTVIVVGTLLLGAGAVLAQQDAVKLAQDTMKANGRNMGTVLGPMVKGEKPYDQAAVDAALNQFDDTAKKLPTMFPASVKNAKWEGDFSPSPKIWDDKAGYDAKVASFAKVVSEAKAKVKDLDSLKANFPGIGRECGACHETYRLKKG